MAANRSVKAVFELKPESSIAPSNQEPIRWVRYVKRIIGLEVARVANYFDRVWVVRDPCESDEFDLPLTCEAVFVSRVAQLPEPCRALEDAHAVVLNGTVNSTEDIHTLLTDLRRKVARRSRVVCIIFNSYLKPLYALLNLLRLRRAPQPRTFVTFAGLIDLAKVTGFEVVRARPSGFCPWRLFGVGDFLNRWLPAVPFVRWGAFATVVVLRPIQQSAEHPSLSVVVPIRNERGNIERAFEGLVKLRAAGLPLDAIFVEGHSTDGSWDELCRVRELHQHSIPVALARQSGVGKVDAVRHGFDQAKGDLLTILDADLSVPPELLQRFYDAYVSGSGDFINGSRLVYPMERKAMPALNFLGNLFFSKLLSAILGIKLSDSLCGTKLLARRDYLRMKKWRNEFGDFDPFGDFELLFPAAVLGLGTINVPIRYRARTYGTSNIYRFYHGLKLLRMCWVGFLKISLGDVRLSKRSSRAGGGEDRSQLERPQA